MKLFFALLFSGYLIPMAGNCQTAFQNKINPAKYKPYEVTIKSNAIKNESLYYFNIIDARLDTNRLGFMYDGENQIFLHFPKPAPSYLSPKINKSKMYTDTLHMVLNKLWLYESIALPARREEKNKTRPEDYRFMGFGRIAADIYKRDGNGWRKILSYDSSVRSTGYMANNADYLLAKNLNILLHDADSLSKIFPLESFAVVSNILPQSDYPILQTQSLRNGIYLKFEDFINNNPVDIDFDYQVKKGAEFMTLKDSRPDDSLYIRYNWGFCKDGVAYMRIGNSFSKLTRIENSFELRAVDVARFYSATKIDEVDVVLLGIETGLNLGDPAALLSGLITRLIPMDKNRARYENITSYKLDLQTGKLY